MCRPFEKLNLQAMPPQIQETFVSKGYFSTGGKLEEEIQNGFCFGWPNINPVVLKKAFRSSLGFGFEFYLCLKE